MLRKSNLVPNTSQGFDSSKQLARKHVRLVGAHAAWVDIVWSKTLQFRLKVLKFPLLRIPGSELCLVAALKNMLDLVPAGEEQPLFLRSSGRAWTYAQFQDKLRVCLKHAGYNEKMFSSHSLRRGGCTFCFQAGVPDFLIKVIGDWKSDIYQNYCQVLLVTRTKACQRFRNEILKLHH